MRPTVAIVAGLGFGDEGKGSIVDYLTRQMKAGTVIRYNGGAQAAHNVLADGRHHTFQQFGAGTFAGARTFLSKYMLVNPNNLLAEARALAENGVADPLRLMAIDSRTRIITPFHVAANRLRELHRGDARHGSCGEGIGETVSDWLEYGNDEMISADDLHLEPSRLRTKLMYVRAIKREQIRQIISDLMLDRIEISDPRIERELQMFADNHVLDMCVERYKKVAPFVVDGDEHLANIVRTPVIFEGAQGVLLDEWHGFNPYTTWSTTTFKNADEMLAPFKVKGRRIGVLRAYATRHGAGPLVTEDPTLKIPDVHNGNGQWQGDFRIGHLDLVMLRYAIEAVSGVDEIALTNLDRVPAEMKVCERYEGEEPRAHTLTPQSALVLAHVKPVYAEQGDIIRHVQTTANAPATIVSRGPRAEDKTDCGVFGTG